MIKRLYFIGLSIYAFILIMICGAVMPIIVIEWILMGDTVFTPLIGKIEETIIYIFSYDDY